MSTATDIKPNSDNENSSIPTSSPTSSSPPMKPSNQLQRPTPPKPDRPLTEIIGDKFPPFDHETHIVTPFSAETQRDVLFSQELGAMLLDVILETHAWAAARPKHQADIAVHKFEQKIFAVIEVEKEQGMFPLPHDSSSPSFYVVVVERTRERLNEFVTRMKTALAALTGLGGI